MASAQRLLISVCLMAACFGCSGHRRFPQFAYEQSRGCSDLVVAAWSGDETEVLYIELDRRQVSLTPGTATVFELNKSPVGLLVVIELYSSRTHNWRCSDMKFRDADKPASWLATAGRLSVTIGSADSVSGAYPVTVEIKDAVFRSSDGRQVRPDRTINILAGAGTSNGG
jgi:hypothetical protein